ncbi:putative nucleic acid-binding protein [Inhella inkyongensis]|uniref:Putative nucleic acid-binding protein n=1 Tax=Inhella inkyongensis TaxID=392593 RepID=A0A840S2T6_9BURK|nr:PIN domain-containing protein [Inhella inkyongensis]MBB5204625.1 putative nucleic acid-binding protein [Inhella inkyongensis]
MSTAPVFVDVGVLLASEDGREPERQRRALAWLAQLWERRCGRLSIQVLNEFYVAATRQAKPMMMGDARAEVRRYQHWQPWPQDAATFEAAFAVEARYGLSYWDSLVLAAAQAQGCRYVLSDELPEGQSFDGVTVLNPFKTGVEVLDAP